MSPRLGVEWQYERWVVRGGYSFLPAALPAQTGLDNYADSDIHQVSLGGGVGWGTSSSGGDKPMTIEVSGQALFMEERTMTKTDAQDPVGTYIVNGVIWYSGLTMRHRF